HLQRAVSSRVRAAGQPLPDAGAGEGMRDSRGSCRPLHAALLAALLSAGFALDAAAAADAAAGKARAQACAVCHGTDGISTAPDAPNLAGQPAIYLSAQLRSFRSGERRHE